MSIHHGISCDLCRRINFSGRRYKCLICNDFDLCSICYDKKINISIQTHTFNHPMQLILTANDYEYIYFNQIHKQRSSMSLTCPLCNQNGFSLNFLIKHINEQQHSILINSVLCPICFIRQNNLSQHLNRHIEENIISKTKIIKQIKTVNSDDIELKQSSKSNEQSLLKELINNQQNNDENKQRNLFIHSLLTNLLS